MYRRSSQGWFKHLDFMVLDVICLHAAFLASYMIRHGIQNPYRDSMYRGLAVVLTLIDLSVLICFDSLKNVLKRGYYREFSATFQHVCLVELILAIYLFTIQASSMYSRIMFYLMGATYFLFTYVMRLWHKSRLKKEFLSENVGMRSLLVVTNEADADEVLRNLTDRNYGNFRIAGLAILDRDCQGNLIRGVPVVADKASVADYACREWIDEVFLNLGQTDSDLEKLARQFSEMGIVVHIALARPVHLNGQKQVVERVGSYTTLTTTINYASPKALCLKRALDILGGLVGCLITGILAVVIGPLIYIQSPGPIFFSQIRVGKNGKKFKMYKFRSMYLDAEERKKELEAQNRVKDGMMFKLDYDPRIIGSKKNPDGTIKKGIGNYIRDWSLDEFPQFFNVLKGDMSLVGTRPPTVDEWEKYELHHRARLAIKPGVTGMWQVSGRSNITDFEEVVKLDTQYISEWSIGLDVKLLLQTVGVVFRGDGAM